MSARSANRAPVLEVLGATGLADRRRDAATHRPAEQIQRALDALWPYTNELFADDGVDQAAAEAGIGVLASSLRPQWLERIGAVAGEATLQLPKASLLVTTGKSGLHSEHMDFLLAEMQVLARAHPGAVW